jgi:hypothetical protein
MCYLKKEKIRLFVTIMVLLMKMEHRMLRLIIGQTIRSDQVGSYLAPHTPRVGVGRAR